MSDDNFMVINAIFIGQDSLGYENGKTYCLEINCNTIRLANTHNEGVCKYGSIEAFLKNWKIK